jgi:hypothetical protein
MLIGILLLLPGFLSAQLRTATEVSPSLTLTPFNLTYQASYQGFKATAQRSMLPLGENSYQLESEIALKLLGQTLSKINEQSTFIWENGELISERYNYTQSGLGKRSRSIEFDLRNNAARTIVDSDEKVLALESPVFDDLNSFIELKRQIAAGNVDIFFHAVDQQEVKEYHYRVLATEQITTPLGLLNTKKIERIREPGNDRKTELWFATDWDYLLVKLYQVSGDDKPMELSLENAILGDIPVTPISSSP